MRSHAKASTAGSNQRKGAGRKPALLLVVLAASLAALVLVVGSASGATTRFFVEVFGSFSQPAFPADRGMAYEQATERLYVIDSTEDTLQRFREDGTPANFPATGSNVIDGEGAGDETPLGHLAFSSNRQREQVAIDESGTATDGNVYVTQSEKDVIDIFSSEGEYLGQLTESTATAEFGEPCGVAVDDEGTVYVGDRGDDRIHVFDPAGAVPVNGDNTASYATVTDPCTMAAGMGATEGFLFVNASTGAQLRKVDAATGEVKYEIATGASTVSVDPATGHVFVARNTGTSSQVDEYDASGATEASLVSSFKPGQTVEGVATNSAQEQVYVSRASTENVEVFGPAAVIPDVVTSPVASNTGTRATLAGTVNPDGVELDECFFEWGEDVPGNPVYGNVVPCAETPAEIGSGTTPVAVHADIDGLAPQGQGYEYRLLATNPNATINGSNQTFSTPTTVVTEAATGTTATETTLHGTVNPDTATISECVFEVGPPKGPGADVQTYSDSVPCVPGPGAITGESPVAVEADLSELDPGTTYHFRLKATYPSGPVLGADEVVLAKGPTIAATWAEDVVTEEAVLKAEVNPRGKATSYRFQWGESTAYGSESTEASAGSGSSAKEVSVFLDGLDPGTTYHYRLVAINADAESIGPDRTITTFEPFAPETDCPNQAVRNGASAALPDCRAYEMVSPVDKNGGEIRGAAGPNNLESRGALNQASPDGGKITYSSGTAFGDVLSSRNSNQYIATRGDDGWSTHAINAPLGPIVTEEGSFTYDLAEQFKLFTPDLSAAWVLDHNQATLTPDAAQGWPNLYRRDNAADSFTALTTSAPDTASTVSNFQLEVEGHSADFSHIVFAADGALTPNAVPASNRPQLYDYAGGQLHLVSVLPDGTAAPLDASAGLFLDASTHMHNAARQHAVSEDGSRIFWSHGGYSLKNGLYVRENPTQPQSALDSEDNCTEPAKACTRGIGDSNAATFVAANPDGSRAIYTEGPTQKFIASGALQSAAEIFEVDVDTGVSNRIAGQSSGVLAASEDLSRIYLVSEEDLAPGASAGEQNVYLYEDGELTFIAAVARHDVGDVVSLGWGYTITGIRSIHRAVRLSEDGRVLAFQSIRSLTGYDNTDVKSGERVVEVYVYDAEADELTCASCRPTGARPEAEVMEYPYAAWGQLTKDAGFTRAAAWLQTEVKDLYHSRALLPDGSRLYFNSFDALVQGDTNGAQDVYQWTAQGAHGCAKEGGCLALISGGGDPFNSEFVDASEDGSTVFIETESSFDSRDSGQLDIYAAREGGGYPPRERTPECVGDACQSVPEPPNDPTPSSAAFRGAGNPPASRNCTPAARRAVKLSRRAKRLRRAAKRSSAPRRSKQLRRRSTRFAKQAKRLSRNAKRCRRANRRASR